MCGIAGIFSFHGKSINKGRIELLTKALLHRGQDGSKTLYKNVGVGSSQYGGIALGHRRLAIIDLSEKATQPMTSASTGNILVYNGELYNYLELRSDLKKLGYYFHTKSDSEVVLAAYDVWGESCIERFNGMFAFSIWDNLKQYLFCVRDPIGIKPFYYTLNSSEFAFASESQALAKLYKPNLNSEAIASYLLMMYVPREFSIYDKIKKLLPGHAMRIFHNGVSEIFKYWHLPNPENINISFDAAAEEMEHIFDGAVKRQLQSDVSIGVLLSGGFDSGMILSSAAKNNISLHSYTIGYTNNKQNCELDIASQLAKRYSTQHHQKILQTNEIMPILNKAIACLSEPVFDSAIVPTYCLSDMAKNDGVKVLLSGTGGDEVFGGYSRYVASSNLRQLLYYLPDFFRKKIAAKLFSNSLLGARLNHRSIDMMIYTGGSSKLASNLFSSKKKFLDFLDYLACSVFPSSKSTINPLYQHMHHDLQVYLPDLLLMVLDQVTMSHTIEGRVPLLDHELLKAAYRLPANYHANPLRNETRLLMRHMAKGRLSSQTFALQKKGFSGPVESWVSSNQESFNEVVMSLRDHPIIGIIPIETIWKSGIKNQSREWAMQIFSLYVLAKWIDNHDFKQ